MKKIITSENFLNILKYGIIAYLGVFLIKSNFISESYKSEVILGTLGVAFIFSRNEVSNFKFYFSLKDFWRALSWYTVAIFIGSLALYLYSIHFDKEWGSSQRTLLQYSVGIVIVQEILFRFILWELGKKIFGEGFKNEFKNIILNTFSFAVMHIVYKGFWVDYLWLLMLFAGLLFAILFYFLPKLYMIIPTHIVLNAIAVHFGVFH
ncbi:CPBP family intramembrane metalloprotease [Candidatus Nomurabacteria bacterium]|nr:CPBP family intramembrane metalloprotease [Candidatus Nomurabacteria bacterium]